MKFLNDELLKNAFFAKSDFVLFNEDSLNFLEKLPENSVDMIFADPPYNLSNGGFTNSGGKTVSVNKGDWDKSKGSKEDFKFHKKWISVCWRVLKPGGTMWISGTYHSIYQCGFALQLLNAKFLNEIIWYKSNASPNLSGRMFTASHETLIWVRKEEITKKGAIKTTKHFFNYELSRKGNWPEDSLKVPEKQMRSVWRISATPASEKTFGKHPTQKPENLLKRIILLASRENDVILDPFSGSGTTGIVAKRYGRKYVGCDLNKNFLEISQKRYENEVKISRKNGDKK